MYEVDLILVKNKRKPINKERKSERERERESEGGMLIIK
jgi:hypothetical protein